MGIKHLLFLLAFIFGYEALSSTTVFLDGEEVKVFFNDGDTFKVLDGELKDERMRIEGFNTLESYGPVHRWGSFREEDLYDNALKATYFARDGEWHCQVMDDRDVYGRLLAVCDDLAFGLLKNGLAHAYFVDENSAKEDYLKEQKKAQEKGLGMWGNGIPKYIITSLHSADEKKAYNRIISTEDGHSKKWQHNDIYETCQWVCLMEAESCMAYVPFEQRYGNKKAYCLKN